MTGTGTKEMASLFPADASPIAMNPDAPVAVSVALPRLGTAPVPALRPTVARSPSRS